MSLRNNPFYNALGAAADALLVETCTPNAQPELLSWQKQRPRDLMFCDNRCGRHITEHARLDNPSYIRHRHRKTNTGDNRF